MSFRKYACALTFGALRGAAAGIIAEISFGQHTLRSLFSSTLGGAVAGATAAVYSYAKRRESMPEVFQDLRTLYHTGVGTSVGVGTVIVASYMMGVPPVDQVIPGILGSMLGAYWGTGARKAQFPEPKPKSGSALPVFIIA